ncbi:hypothetical protein HRbin30_02693 [bacterium HR30]|nr:hypothetical protein HRbin30_02693 [bacterium HR30]
MLYPIRRSNHENTALLHEFLQIPVNGSAADRPHSLAGTMKHFFCGWVTGTLGDCFPNRLQLSGVTLRLAKLHWRSSAKEALTGNGTSAAAW